MLQQHQLLDVSLPHPRNRSSSAEKSKGGTETHQGTEARPSPEPRLAGAAPQRSPIPQMQQGPSHQPAAPQAQTFTAWRMLPHCVGPAERKTLQTAFSPICVWDMQFIFKIKWKGNRRFEGLFLLIPCPPHLHHSPHEK